jgi:dihydrofolate reductase
MRRVRYGVGMSLDGYIADGEGGTDWLVADPAYDPGPFFASIDTVLMGRITYESAVRQGMRAYPKLRNIVFSRSLRPSDYPEVTVIASDAVETVAQLRRQPGQDIWLCGGGVLFRSLLGAGLVDTVELGVSPLLLGRRGVAMLSLIPELPAPVRLELRRHDALPTGLLVLEYSVHNDAVQQAAAPGGDRRSPATRRPRGVRLPRSSRKR